MIFFPSTFSAYKKPLNAKKKKLQILKDKKKPEEPEELSRKSLKSAPLDLSIFTERPTASATLEFEAPVQKRKRRRLGQDQHQRKKPKLEGFIWRFTQWTETRAKKNGDGRECKYWGNRRAKVGEVAKKG